MVKRKLEWLKDKQFKKGQSGNPLGGKLHNPVIKAFKNLTRDELLEVGNLVIKNDVATLKRIAADPKATVLKTMLAAVSVKIISKGDMHALNMLLDRLIGKVRDEVHFTGATEDKITVAVNWADQEPIVEPPKEIK